MTLTLRPADLEADRDLIIETLRRLLTPRSTPARFDWLYRANPHGPARAWIGCDAATGDVAAVASAFPRRLFRDQGEIPAWVLGDFCVAERYRTLGPALELQRACLSGLEGEGAIWYDFPSASMMAVYQRLGMRPVTRIVRHARPLRLGPALRSRIPLGPLAGGLGRAADGFLRRWRRTPADARFQVSVEPVPGPDEIEALARTVGTRNGICVRRTAAYLTWRFSDHPLESHELLAAREDRRLVAYAVVQLRDTEATVVDLFGPPDSPCVALLLEASTRLADERRAVTLSVPLAEGHPWEPTLRRCGFRPREAAPVVIGAGGNPPADRLPGSWAGWHLMHGDRDS